MIGVSELGLLFCRALDILRIVIVNPLGLTLLYLCMVIEILNVFAVSHGNFFVVDVLSFMTLCTLYDSSEVAIFVTCRTCLCVFFKSCNSFNVNV